MGNIIGEALLAPGLLSTCHLFHAPYLHQLGIKLDHPDHPFDWDAFVNAMFQAADTLILYQGGEAIDVIAYMHKMLAVGSAQHGEGCDGWVIKNLPDHILEAFVLRRVAR
jgi:hypothetical protein